MQSILINESIRPEKIISLSDYLSIPDKKEYVLYADNILEGITLLNLLTQTKELLFFYAVVYEPIDQPIYIFKDDRAVFYAIKICGAYNKWNLPEAVIKIKDYIDLPDYILYSLYSKKPILAGENTETASVGNSQWQREGRKLGAAKCRCPFIYQTFYSGKDESLATTREPSSLQVYNQLVYSVRYRVPSIVAYFENNFEGASTRVRYPKDSTALFIRYIKSILLSDIHPECQSLKRNCEQQFFRHMIDYLKEGKYDTHQHIDSVARLNNDLPVIDPHVKEGLLVDTDSFVKALLAYLYGESNDFIAQYPLDRFNHQAFVPWKAYGKKPYIRDLILYLAQQGRPAVSYKSGNSKIAWADTRLCRQFLENKFSESREAVAHILDAEKYPQALLMPLRIHKKSNGQLTFSPDPESGEIAAFCELFGYTCLARKKHPVIGYCIVDTPTNFDLHGKTDTKLYKALANYIDILILNNAQVITSFASPVEETPEEPVSIPAIYPKSLTEEMAIVSTYLNLSTIRDKWLLCFIHTHHSSWQQFMLHDRDGKICQHKIDRVSTKLDLIMQDKSLFLLAEGKNKYAELMSDRKIGTAMRAAGKLIDQLYAAEHTTVEAFIYNYPLPSQDPEAGLKQEVEKVQQAIARGDFAHLANVSDFVVIIVCVWPASPGVHTKFKLVYSESFDPTIRARLDAEFNS